MREPIVIANWKMNGSLGDNRLWVRDFLAKGPVPCRTAVCAPFVYLPEMIAALKDTPVAVGAQTVSTRLSGAFTGEVSAPMLADIGVSCCIVGHSERRSLWNEANEDTAEQARRLVDAGIRPVVCVGETLAEREEGRTFSVVLGQLAAVLERIAIGDMLALAYEPVWAIGTGRTATPEQAQEVHAALRAALRRIDPEQADRLPILYGGSVKPGNARELFACPDIDGGLIGGAALKADDFHCICSAVRAD